MTYPNQLTKQGEQAVAPYVDSIIRLKPGESLRISFIDPSQTQRVRYYLYVWRYINDLTATYGIRSEGPKTLCIIHRDMPAGTVTRVQPQETPAQAFVKSSLLTIETEDAALKEIYDAISRGDLTMDDGPEALQEWRRIQG